MSIGFDRLGYQIFRKNGLAELGSNESPNDLGLSVLTQNGMDVNLASTDFIAHPSACSLQFINHIEVHGIVHDDITLLVVLVYVLLFRWHM
jgi:hypothetical protein